MLGAIIGDIVGSVYEWDNIKTIEFTLFKPDCFITDDSVMTLAVAQGLMKGGGKEDYVTAMKKYGRIYPEAGYGGHFYDWIFSAGSEPYNSWGNGSAMRVSPVAWVFDTEEVEEAAAVSAGVTHNHPEGISGAMATAACIFWARQGMSKSEIREACASRYGYDLDQTLDEIRPDYEFDVSCQGTVPQAIIAFLESEDFEDAIRNAFLWAATAIHWTPSQGALRRHITAYPGTFGRRPCLIWMKPFWESGKRGKITFKSNQAN